MSVSANPWLTPVPSEGVMPGGGAGVSRVEVPSWGFDPSISPQGAAYIASVRTPYLPGITLVGAHGGAGVSTLARLTGMRDGGHVWPMASGITANRVVMVARTHAHGLEAARDAAMRYYTGNIGGVALVGVVLVADLPERRLPRILAESADIVAGAYPVCWRLGWVESIRTGTYRTDQKLPSHMRRVIAELGALHTERSN